MSRTPVNSSNVASIGYDEQTQTAEIEFKGGRVYRYRGVPADVWARIASVAQEGASVGRAVNAELKAGGFAFELAA